MRSGTLLWLVVLGAALGFAIGAPETAHACGSCFNGNEKAREAYYLTTVLLAVVPFSMLGGILWWLHRAARRAQASHELPLEAGQ